MKQKISSTAIMKSEQMPLSMEIEKFSKRFTKQKFFHIYNKIYFF